MKRRQFLGTTAGIAAASALSATTAAAANGGTLVNATTTPSGAIVATDDDFEIAGQHVTIAGGTYYESDDDHIVVYTNGYSGTIRDNTFTVTSVQDGTIAIRVDGGTVDVTGNTISEPNDINQRFIGVSAVAGATVTVSRNEITGAHRVGVVGQELGTTLDVSRNTITGPGPRTTGWADNGVQLSDDATGTIRDNVISDHWYAPNSFVSSGVLAYLTNDVVVQRNDITDNDLGVALLGDRNNVIHNDVTATYPTTSTYHYGVIVYGGDDNGIRQNTTSTAATTYGYAGIYNAGANTKLIRNTFDGWTYPIADAGTDTKLPKPFDPTA